MDVMEDRGDTRAETPRRPLDGRARARGGGQGSPEGHPAGGGRAAGHLAEGGNSTRAQSPPLGAPGIRCQLPATLSPGLGAPLGGHLLSVHSSTPPRMGWHMAPWLSECAEGSEEAPQAGGQGSSRVTSPVVLPEKLLAVVGGVRLLHLRDPVPRPLPLERWGEEGGPVVPLGGGGCAEGGYLGTRSMSPGQPADLGGPRRPPISRLQSAASLGLGGRWPPAPPREEAGCPPGASTAPPGSSEHRASLAAHVGRAPSRHQIRRTFPTTPDVETG